MVAESTSPVGNGTAGLLFINGNEPLPFRGALMGPFDGKIAFIGDGLGEVNSCGRLGHGYDGDDDTMSPPPPLTGLPLEVVGGGVEDMMSPTPPEVLGCGDADMMVA